MKNKKGLTLIELLAVIAIIAILFVLLIPSINSAIYKAIISGVQTDFRSYEIALKSFLFENGGDGGKMTEEKLNPYLDEALRFENSLSKKLNPFGVPYVLNFDIAFSEIYTVENKKEPREFRLVFNMTEYEDAAEREFGVKQVGFEYEEYGVPFCEVTTKRNTDYEYKICDGDVVITNYLGSAKDVVVPPQIDGRDVVYIERSSSLPTSRYYQKSFEAKGLTSVVLPDTVKIIGRGSFFDNRIETVTLPSKVKKIGDYTFGQNKIKSLTIPPSLTKLSWGSFWNNDLTSIHIPNTVDIIETYAFFENELDDVYLPAKFKNQIDVYDIFTNKSWYLPTIHFE